MLSAGKIAPALIWRAFFVFLFANALFAGAPPSRPPELSQIGKPDAAEAAQLLDQFRKAGIPGQFFLQFELRSLPRRGQGRTFQGRLWGGRNEQGAIMRVEIVDAAGATHRLLIQNGERGGVWRVTNGRAAQLGIAELFAPLIPGVEVTAFDLQMPYLYWPDASLEKVARSVLGRPAYAYLVPAPEAFAKQYPDVTAARAYLDTQFNALVQTELIGRGNKPIKTFAFLSVKRVGEQYVPKMADYRNEATRDKTRLQVTGAALNLRLPPAVFDPAQLGHAIAPPPPVEITRIDP